MGKKVTTDEWVARAKDRWGDRFDYSRAIWINKRTRITVGCPVHGWVEVSPETHLHNRAGSTGCPRCGKEQAGVKRRSPDWEARQNKPPQKKRLTEEDFKKRLKNRWGNQFELAKDGFTATNSPVNFTCKTHGDLIVFSKASNLLHNGKIWPCQKCKIEEKTQEFIQKARAIHGDAYDYKKSIWSPEHIGEPIIITCPKHGDWNSGMYHIKASGQKAGCPKCAHENVNKHRVEEARKSFAKKARSIHGKNYDYERVEYINNHTPVDIFCRKHQLFFSQIPNSHLNGAGCPECALEKIRENRIESLEGKVFGKLKVIRFDHKRKRKTRQGNSFHRYWLCKCECGKEKVIFQTQLTTGNTISCGCNKYDNLINAEISALHDPEVAEIETELYFVEVGKIFHKFGISIHSAEIRGGKDYTKIYWRYRDRRDVVVPVESVLHSMTKDYFDIERIAEEDFDRWPGWTELRCQLDTSFWIRKAEELLTECHEMGYQEFLSYYHME